MSVSCSGCRTYKSGRCASYLTTLIYCDAGSWRRWERALEAYDSGDRARTSTVSRPRCGRLHSSSAGLKTLAGHLLTLAQDGTPNSAHLLEENNGLETGSVGLVLERCDDE